MVFIWGVPYNPSAIAYTPPVFCSQVTITISPTDVPMTFNTLGFFIRHLKDIPGWSTMELKLVGWDLDIKIFPKLDGNAMITTLKVSGTFTFGSGYTLLATTIGTLPMYTSSAFGIFTMIGSVIFFYP